MATNIRWRDFIINILLAPVYIEPNEGAKTCIYLATSDEVKNETGNFYSKSRPIVLSKKYNDKTTRAKLLQYYETIYERLVTNTKTG